MKNDDGLLPDYGGRLALARLRDTFAAMRRTHVSPLEKRQPARSLTSLGWDSLTHDERKLMAALFRDDIPLSTAAHQLGFTREYANLLRAQAIHKMVTVQSDDPVMARLLALSPRGPGKFERVALPKGMRGRILERDGWRCRRCGAQSQLQIDHIIPVSRGGDTVFENLQTLCGSCNSRKRARVESPIASSGLAGVP